MKITGMKTANIKINNNIKITVIITTIILGILIVLPLIFLDVDQGGADSFNLKDESLIKSSQIVFPANGKVKLYRKAEDKVEEIDLEEYIMGVVASEMPASFEEEALKAQAVAARTFYMNRRNNPSKDDKEKGAEVCDTSNCQVYMSKEERMSKWSSEEKESNWNKIQKAVLDTKGQVLTYNGAVLEYPQFFAISSGKTEDAKDVLSIDVPYLKSEESKGEEIAPKYKSTVKVPINEFVNKINAKYKDAKIKINDLVSQIKIENYTEAGSVKEIKIGNEEIKGTEFRELFNLNSTNFILNFGNDGVKIDCTGYGHGVGMSQWGADVMAKNGETYDKILKHYYNGVELQTITYK